MILQTGSNRRALTFVEIIAVITLIAIATGVAVQGFRASSGPARRLSQGLIRDIQGAYHQSLRRGEIFRMDFYPQEHRYQLLRFEFPPPPPSEDDIEAYREWEEENRERQDKLRELTPSERSQLTALDLADYVLVEEREYSDNLEIVTFEKENSNLLEPDNRSILFYPTGELESVLIVIEDAGGRQMSLFTEPYTGRVQTFNRGLSADEWKELRNQSGGETAE